MLYNPFNFQSNDNWDTDGLYWYNEFYTKKPVRTSLNQFHGLQKTGPRWSGSVPTMSGSVLDRLRSTVARFWGKKPDWTGLANTICFFLSHQIIEDALDESFQQCRNSTAALGGDMHDVHDSPAWQDLTGLFSTAHHLVFGLYIDWFNPFTNKIGGMSEVFQCYFIYIDFIISK